VTHYTSRVVALVSLFLVGGVLVYVAVSDHHDMVPPIYDTLDKSKPWNEIAQQLDPQMSDGEYNAMRTRYFYDVVAPKLNEKESRFAAYEYFMQRTDRPWQWNRRPSRGEPPRGIQLTFVIASAYLVVAALIWTWRRILRPAGRIIRDEGLAGLANVLLHGRKSRVDAHR
jgi:hypothetical protein